MSKIEMVRGLAASKSATLMDLAEQIQSLQSSLVDLPPAVAQLLSETIGPLLNLPDQVEKALAAFDQINAAQRATILETTAEIGRLASAAMEKRVAAMEAPISTLTASVQQLGSTFNNVSETGSALSVTSHKLAETTAVLSNQSVETQQAMRDAAQQYVTALGTMLTKVESRIRPAWHLPAMMIACAMIAALMAPLGTAVSKRFLTPSVAEIPKEVQQNADLMSALIEKSSAEEKALLNKILSRPAQ